LGEGQKEKRGKSRVLHPGGGGWRSGKEKVIQDWEKGPGKQDREAAKKRASRTTIGSTEKGSNRGQGKLTCVVSAGSRRGFKEWSKGAVSGHEFARWFLGRGVVRPSVLCQKGDHKQTTGRRVRMKSKKGKETFPKMKPKKKGRPEERGYNKKGQGKRKDGLGGGPGEKSGSGRTNG